MQYSRTFSTPPFQSFYSRYSKELTLRKMQCLVGFGTGEILYVVLTFLIGAVVHSIIIGEAGIELGVTQQASHISSVQATCFVR